MIKKEIPTSLDFEILNITPVNPFISECEIKVFYHGKNRNGSYISKPVGSQIANGLPRSPIVAFYNEQIEDYEDHGEELIINKNGIKFVRKTVPYGAVDQLSPIGWKEYIDADGKTREYLVCKGYLWTGRYPHLQSVIESGKGQSMEFFPESVKGDWAIFPEDNQEFFIMNEAVISALCILGDDVEPCFEGASVHAPEVLYSLKKDEFTKDFNSFMFELNKVLNEGSLKMENLDQEVEVLDENVQTDLPETDNSLEDEKVETDTVEVTVEVEAVETTEEVVEDNFTAETEVETVSEEVPDSTFTVEDYTKLQNDFAQLKADYEALSEKYSVLEAEKSARIEAEKDEVINKFSTILGEDIEKVKSAKLNFSVEQIEEKLAAMAFVKGVSFTSNQRTTNDVPVLPKVSHSVSDETPAWLKVVDKKIQSKNS